MSDSRSQVSDRLKLQVVTAGIQHGNGELGVAHVHLTPMHQAQVTIMAFSSHSHSHSTQPAHAHGAFKSRSGCLAPCSCLVLVLGPEFGRQGKKKGSNKHKRRRREAGKHPITSIDTTGWAMQGLHVAVGSFNAWLIPLRWRGLYHRGLYPLAQLPLYWCSVCWSHPLFRRVLVFFMGRLYFFFL